jgi:hypothetical protein
MFTSMKPLSMLVVVMVVVVVVMMIMMRMRMRMMGFWEGGGKLHHCISEAFVIQSSA